MNYNSPVQFRLTLGVCCTTNFLGSSRRELLRNLLNGCLSQDQVVAVLVGHPKPIQGLLSECLSDPPVSNHHAAAIAGEGGVS